MEEKEYLSINGNSFLYRNTEIEWISPLEGGYIITPDGYFIPVKDSDDHSTIFSEYLTKYLEKRINLNTIEATIMLTKNNHIVYMGIKMSDMKDVYAHNGTCEGFGILIFPNDINSLSKEQKEACSSLIAINRRVFGNGEKIPMQYHSISSNGSTAYNKEQILSILNKNKNTSK